jgi:CRP-like cAMP-binding protein
MDMNIDARTLGQLDFLRGLPAAALETLAASARVRGLPRDSRVFSQGDENVRAHVLLEGGLRIAQVGSDGGEVTIRFIAPGETFGTMALFTDRRYPADAVALMESREVSWSEGELMALMAECPELAIAVIRMVGRRLQEVQVRGRELATQRVEQRVANAVLRLAAQAGHRSAQGIEIAFPLRRRDVADIAGTTLHSVSRILTAWERKGLIAGRQQHLILCRRAALERVAEEGEQA